MTAPCSSGWTLALALAPFSSPFQSLPSYKQPQWLRMTNPTLELHCPLISTSAIPDHMSLHMPFLAISFPDHLLNMGLFLFRIPELHSLNLWLQAPTLITSGCSEYPLLILIKISHPLTSPILQLIPTSSLYSVASLDSMVYHCNHSLLSSLAALTIFNLPLYWAVTMGHSACIISVTSHNS